MKEVKIISKKEFMKAIRFWDIPESELVVEGVGTLKLIQAAFDEKANYMFKAEALSLNGEKNTRYVMIG